MKLWIRKEELDQAARVLDTIYDDSPHTLDVVHFTAFLSEPPDEELEHYIMFDEIGEAK